MTRGGGFKNEGGGALFCEFCKVGRSRPRPGFFSPEFVHPVAKREILAKSFNVPVSSSVLARFHHGGLKFRDYVSAVGWPRPNLPCAGTHCAFLSLLAELFGAGIAAVRCAVYIRCRMRHVWWIQPSKLTNDAQCLSASERKPIQVRPRSAPPTGSMSSPFRADRPCRRVHGESRCHR